MRRVNSSILGILYKNQQVENTFLLVMLKDRLARAKSMQDRLHRFQKTHKNSIILAIHKSIALRRVYLAEELKQIKLNNLLILLEDYSFRKVH